MMAGEKDYSADHSSQPVFRHEDYSGLQVVETGPEVVVDGSGGLPEVSPRTHQAIPQAQYAEHKQQSPPQALYQQPEAYSYALPPGSAPAHAHGGSTPPYSGSTAAASDHQYNGGHNPYHLPGDKPASRREGQVCGLRKKIFWVLLALFAAGVIVAIAVGLGVGLGVRTSSSSSAASSSSSSTSSATTTAAPTATTLPAAVASATANSTTDVLCPAANLTLYTLESTDKRYLVLCGRDYNSDGGAEDIVSMNVTTFEGCLAECGSTEGCTAVGWGNYYGTNTCWLKASIGAPSWSGSWYAAVQDDSG